MAERTIKHGLFTYWTPVEQLQADGEVVSRFTEQMAFAGQTVDIPREQDIARGEEHGAFYTEEELKRSAAAPAASEETAEEVELKDLDDEELVDWLMSTGEFDGNKKPTVPEVVAAGADDPGFADRLLKAEHTASGGDPRDGVVKGLEAVAQPAS
jgi:hypothetical protein